MSQILAPNIHVFASALIVREAASGAEEKLKGQGQQGAHVCSPNPWPYKSLVDLCFLFAVFIVIDFFKLGVDNIVLLLIAASLFASFRFTLSLLVHDFCQLV